MDELKARIQEVIADFHVNQLSRYNGLGNQYPNHYYVSRKSMGGRITEPVRERQVAFRMMHELQAEAVALLFQQEMMAL